MPLLVVGAVVGAPHLDELDPPGALPSLPATARRDIALEVDARRRLATVEVDLAVTIPAGGDVLQVADWAGTEVVGQQLSDGQVVLHLSLAGPEPSDDVLPIAPPQPPPPLVFLPGRTLSADATFAAPGRSVPAFRRVGRLATLRADEVRVCLWATEHDGEPAVCADDEV